MKLTIGWWKARDGSKWHVDWVGENRAVGHSESGIAAMWDAHDGESILNSGIIQDLVESWTEPKFRPWKPEEVPHNDWFRFKDNPTSWTKVEAVDSKFIYFSNGYEGTPETLVDVAEHSLDNGKTWLPCGVME